MKREPKTPKTLPRNTTFSRHRVLISDDPAQWRRVVRSFFQEGLALDQPCLCLHSLITKRSVCRFMEAAGVDVEAAQREGLLIFLATDQVFNQDGVFSPTNCLGVLVKTLRQAVPQRWGTIRVAADMNWAADSRLNHARLLVYEELINRRLLTHFPVDLLCYYDRALFPPGFLNQVRALHDGEVPLMEPAGTGSGLPVSQESGHRRLRLSAL